MTFISSDASEKNYFQSFILGLEFVRIRMCNFTWINI